VRAARRGEVSLRRRLLRPGLAALLALAGPARAQSCLETAPTSEAFRECMQAEILPLETKVVHLTNELRAKERGSPGRLAAFDRDADAWNERRNRQCTLEGERAGGDLPAKRAFGSCAKRELLQRIGELEAR
jgi:uncharacterized protein YecT (DUF1311 family)